MDRARTHENNTHNNRRISGSALRRNPCNRRPTGGHRRTSSPPGSACTAGRRRSSRGLRHLPEKPSWSRSNLFEVRSVRRRHRHRAVRRISSALASMMSGVPPVGWCRSATIEDAGSQRGRNGVAHPFPSPLPAPKWCRAIANVTRNERVPAYSPVGAAKPRPNMALVFNG